MNLDPNIAVNSKVEIRFHVESAKWIPDTIRPKLLVSVSMYCIDFKYNFIKLRRVAAKPPSHNRTFLYPTNIKE